MRPHRRSWSAALAALLLTGAAAPAMAARPVKESSLPEIDTPSLRMLDASQWRASDGWCNGTPFGCAGAFRGGRPAHASSAVAP